MIGAMYYICSRLNALNPFVGGVGVDVVKEARTERRRSTGTTRSTLTPTSKRF